METMNLPAPQVMYEALLNKDSRFEGIFFAGITTTGIFCRPTCTARKPKPENVQYFPNAREAMAYGFRPCKVCHPMEMNGANPEWIRPLLEEIHQNPEQRYKNADLAQKGMNAGRVARWFKKQHGMTFHAYLRMIRVSQAFGQIKYEGEKVTEAAFGTGYESLSGFSESFKKTTGFAPVESRRKLIVTLNRILTPLGPMFACATEKGICMLEFTDRRMLETQLKRIRSRFKAEIVTGVSPWFALLDEQLREYFDGKRTEFDLPLDLPGTDFQRQVWAALQTIPCGKTRSYQEQARVIGRPTAVRAVAHANGDNPIAIIVPCHRVIGADGSLTGYGGGIWRKQWLLEHEFKMVDG